MNPGDLVTPSRWNLTYRVPIDYLEVWDKPDGTESWQGKWEHDEIGVLLGGKYMSGDPDSDPTSYTLVEVLLKGRICWVDEDLLRAIK